MLLVDQKLRCIPKSYQVSSEAKKGFFETDKVFIKKINPSVAELQQPYIFQLSREEYVEDEDMEECDFPKKKQSKSRPVMISTGNKAKRVSMSPAQLQENLFKIFQEKHEFKLSELEGRLNHPTAPLKAALTNICTYDFRRKLYILRDEFK